MKKNLFTKTAALLAVASFAVVGCKTGSDAQNFVKHIKLSQDAQSFEYTTSFSQNVEVDMEAEIPVGKYGSISFFKDDQGQFSVKMKATFDIFGDTTLIPATTLPNGLSFPSIVTGPLYQVKVADVEGEYSVYAYFDNPMTTGKKLAGLAIQFDNIKNNLPQVTITQSFFTDDNQKFASFTVFGPMTKNGVTYPGGLFLVGDVNQAIDTVTAKSNTLGIAGPEAAKYKSERSKKFLMYKVKKALEANGIVYEGH